MNDVNPQECLADVLVKLPETITAELYSLLPNYWKKKQITEIFLYLRYVIHHKETLFQQIQNLLPTILFLKMYLDSRVELFAVPEKTN
jgi:hypothetical protein